MPLAFHRLDDERRPLRPTYFVLLSIATVQLHYYAIVFPALYVLLSAIRRRHLRTALAALALSSLSLAS
jgi:hypothetical protein